MFFIRAEKIYKNGKVRSSLKKRFRVRKIQRLKEFMNN
jgi:hypothetical protein